MLFKEGLFRNYGSLFLYLFKGLDLAFLLFSLLLATTLTNLQGDFFLIACLFLLVGLIYFKATTALRLYESRRTTNLGFEISSLSLISIISYFLAFAILVVASSLFNQLNPPGFIPNLAKCLALACAVHLVILLPTRSLFRYLLRVARAKGLNQRHIVLVGDAQTNENIYNEIQELPEYGLQVIGQVITNQSVPAASSPLANLGEVSELESTCNSHGVDQIWLTSELNDRETVESVLDTFQHQTISIRHVLDFSYLNAKGAKFTSFREIPLLDIEVSPLNGATSQIVKSIEDKLLAIVALTIASPIMLIVACGVKLSSPGPVFYRQKRMTWNNEVFEMLKFRTMPIGSDKKSTGWSSKDKGKTNAFTAFLRKTSLDELPQLINVLKGEMSLVGPRPERPEYIAQFKTEIPRYMKKHMVKAGITGWAQVNGYRGDTDLNARIDYDLEYVRNWTPGFDIFIMWQTVFKGFVNQNAY